MSTYEKFVAAIKYGTVEDVKNYIENKLINININMSIKLRTPLHHAISNKNINVAKYLVSKGAAINARTHTGETPLHYAAQDESCFDTARFLISMGADINAKKQGGDSVLHVAARCGNVKLVKTLIATGADVGTKNNDGKTPLHLVSNIEIANVLVSNGANVNAKNNKGVTPLHIAAATGNILFTKFLVSQRANTNAKDKLGETPIYWALRYNNINMTGLTHYPAHADVIKYLISECGVNVNSRAKHGQTPLHLTALMGNVEFAKLLVSLGADINAKDYAGQTPLDYAKQKNHVEMIIYFYNISYQHSFTEQPVAMNSDHDNRILKLLLFSFLIFVIGVVAALVIMFFVNQPSTKTAHETSRHNIQPSILLNQISAPTFPGRFPQASERLLTDSDLRYMDKHDLRIMRNEIFARHGYIFQAADLNAYFRQQNWYRARHHDVTPLMSDIEKRNVSTIRLYE